MYSESVTMTCDYDIGGWGAELNQEIVSCRECVRAVYV